MRGCYLFIFYLLMSNFLYSQKKSIDTVGFLDLQNQEVKYGDESNWPVWATGKIDPRKGMDLNTVNLSQIWINEKLLITNIDELVGYTEIKKESNLKTRLYSNGVLTYCLINDKVYLLSVNFMEINDIEINLEGNLFSEQSTLTDISEVFRKSYSWRDGGPNFLHGFFDSSDWINLTFIVLGDTKGINGMKNQVDLHFFKDKLIYLYFRIADEN